MKHVGLVLAVATLAGCGTGVTESDQDAVRAEFSQANYERAMKESGRGEELEAEKERARKHLAGE